MGEEETFAVGAVHSVVTAEVVGEAVEAALVPPSLRISATTVENLGIGRENAEVVKDSSVILVIGDTRHVEMRTA